MYLRLFRRLSFLLVFGSLVVFSNPVQAQENALLVVNEGSRSSKLIANHYAKLRGIPDRNVVVLKGIPNRERVSFQLFKSRILKPILEQIKARKLDRQIDYVLYSADFPTQIAISDEVARFFQAVEKSTGRKTRGGRKIYNPMASINSATYFASRILANQPSWITLDANQYMRKRNSSFLKTPFIGPEALEFAKALERTQQKKYEESNEILQKLAKSHPRQVVLHYWQARNFAKLGQAEKVMESLYLAIQLGWCYRDYTKSDLAFSSLIEDDAFSKLLAAMPNDEFKFLPTIGFRNSLYFGKNGMPNGDGSQGESYLLSTVLAVTRNQGISEAQALRQLSRSVSADGSRPTGYFGFAKTGDVRSKTRLPNFAFTVEALKRYGQQAEVFNGILPKKSERIAGLSIGTRKFSFAGNRSEILAGAICENLTSYGGVLDKGLGQTKLSEFLKFGAAGSSGTVVEPFAIQKKFPHPNIHLHYVKGCTLAEAFYQSVEGPFQLLIVGDGLCRPWAKIPQFKMTGVERGQVVNSTIELTPEIELKGIQDPLKNLTVYIDGAKVFTTQSFGKIKFDTRNLDDGYHEMAFVIELANATRTTGRYTLPIRVKNEGLECLLRTRSPQVQEKDAFNVFASSPGADRIELRQHGRKLGSIAGEKGNAIVRANVLGRGESRIYAVAFHGEKRIRSQPLALKVEGSIHQVVPKPKKPNQKKKQNQKKKPSRKAS